jgi:hypothetical protein
VGGEDARPRLSVHLVQILLPLFDNDGIRLDTALFTDVRGELTDAFGGVTAYSRSPAKGLWKRDDGQIERDEVVMVEVAIESLDRAWWRDYRARLERRFRQDTILIRAFAIETL